MKVQLSLLILSAEPEIKEFTRLQASLYIDQNVKANRSALTGKTSSGLTQNMQLLITGWTPA